MFSLALVTLPGLVMPLAAVPISHEAQARVVADVAYDAPTSFFPAALLGDGAALSTDEEKDRARLAGLGALAFGVLPTVWASSIGIPGALDKDSGTKDK